ncbi:lipid-A-disaccharide synthase-related protein [Calothrix sp. PCC 6303]|uniref:lipid-A-disaccharide synthase-related protein n=1 Tax=Calothrix sp. PCC 6303 TaxID=1170562 RepID=UPI0002A02543|nr:lipid-A-disaccharide synthase-related protein [Calothrix sp. PCC 6303]AFZ03717.1 hypothetical protein Cal6303_4819 [Calothrix sp. PCC 6303]
MTEFPQNPKPESSKQTQSLLILSNGHGEDIIAVRILQELQQQPNSPKIVALPIVGEGNAYKKLNIPLIGSVQTMPSGGFIYMDGKQLMRDVKGGLLQLTINQIKAVGNWVKSEQLAGNHPSILAVGDIVPLLFAYLSGANYGFVGTAKSEYYVRNESGVLKRQNKGSYWENFSGSIYHPWERWLMTRRHCKAVFPRDSLTAEILKTMNVPAFDVGNPMMDGLQPSFSTQRFYTPNIEREEIVRPLIITLLPGSRAPEAYDNWEIILEGVDSLIDSFEQQNSILHTSGKMIFLSAIASSLEPSILVQSLTSQGWQPTSEPPVEINDNQALTFTKKNAYLVITQNAYNDCLHLADLAIAMAGTATEQFVGLGKPAITIPGKGPQFTFAFAEAQSRLLGRSVTLANTAAEVSTKVRSLLANPDEFHVIAENGWRRMGKPGAAQRIAECIIGELGITRK